MGRECPSLTPRSERNDVVELLGRMVEEATYIARRLANALLVLHQRNAYEALAVFAEADARRNGNIGFFHQELGKLHAAERLERFRDLRPGKHRRARRRHVPPSTAKAFDQNVAPAPIARTHLLYAVLGPVERGSRSH